MTVLWVVLVWLAALAASVLGGAVVTPWVLRLAARSGVRGPRSRGRDVRVARTGKPSGAQSDEEGPTGSGAVSALRGGTWIGLLERLGITGSLLAGYPEGIALILAIKGLGRYPELHKYPAASERFVIGTLASVIWSAAVGIAGAAILGALR